MLKFQNLNYPRLSRYRMIVPTVWVWMTFRLGIPGQFIREIVQLRIDCFVPFDNFARISRHSAKNSGHGAVGAVLGFVIRLVVANGVEQVVVLLLIRVLAFLRKLPGVFAAHDVRADITSSLCSDHMLRNIAPTAVDVAALAEASSAVLVFEFYTVMIENFAVIRTFAHFDSTHSVGANRVPLLDPVHDIQIMDVLL